tara:strand:- start:185 stop:2242 length:2058 start_codon:yes stop_codon:yes gene_type:complete
MGFRFTVQDNSDEFIAAENIARQLGDLTYFKDEDSFDCLFCIEPRVGNGKVKHPDILMICGFNKPTKVQLRNPIKWSGVDKSSNEEIKADISSVILRNFIISIEVKMHSADRVRINDSNNLEVYYQKQDYWSNTTQQSREAMFAAKAFIAKKGSFDPKVQSIIYLHNIKKEQFQNIHGTDFPIEIRLNNHGIGFLESICHQFAQYMKPKNILNKVPDLFSALDKDFDHYITCDWKQSNPRPSKFDFKRMNAIAKKVEDWHFKDLSKRMIEYRGLGGTGKTIKLLQIAHQTHIENQKNILFLTYNWALIIGIRLTMEHMGIPNTNGEKSGIKVDSGNAFFWGILRNLGYISKDDEKKLDNHSEHFDEIYQRALEECMSYLKSLNDDQATIKEFLRESSEHDLSVFSDIVLIDEGQDWMPEEQYILECIFGTENILVACGTGQETRGVPTVWGKHLTSSWKQKAECEKRFHTLHKAMRMRGNLGIFVKTFADLTLTDEMYKRMEPNSEALEGRVYVVEGDYFAQKDLRKDLQEKRINEVGDVYALDLLHIIPPKMKPSDFDHGLPDELIWNGVDKKERKKLPTSEKMVRWINYRSCRGLEGWITFNHYLDEYWEYEFNTQKIDIAQGSLFENATEEQKRNEAFRWTLIALTRPIDSTVITLRDKNSELGKILQEVHAAHPNIIDWIS